MKTRLIVSAFAAVLMMLAAADASAQVATKKERKQIDKHEKVLNKEISEKALKEARKEAKRLEKEGYAVPFGQLPMDKQIEKSWQAAYEVDAEGYPFYLMSTQKGFAANYTAAQMQAMNAAKIDIAGQIQTAVSQVIETKVTSNELQPGEAVSLNAFVSNSKNVISNTLGRVLKLVEVYRTGKDGKTEVMVTIAYNSDFAKKEALKAMQNSAASDAELMGMLSKLVEE